MYYIPATIKKIKTYIYSTFIKNVLTPGRGGDAICSQPAPNSSH